MSDTSGLPNTDQQGVPAEDDPERFEQGANAAGDGDGDGDERDAQAAEPAETEQGQGEDEGGAVPPPADFDPAQQPSNPDMVKNVEPPD
ncbi:hypothetical protein ASF88_18670 [Leifsonia sp. Leaf336]|uniref:hypothetical protein n=1 Tax=Leifsonia sp. Leaf336 TaxID=1736341 RepID=UPI0006F96651|nr:hypothetical protein [Leifsonia sp. Leaf336]KQR51208.1 hypothetical protein ASF88_18670 [Leifsonia sp. Leaf336]